MKRGLFNSLMILISISAIASYDFTSSSCANSDVQQSPININYNQTIYSNSNYFRILSNNFKPITPQDKWTYFPNEFAIGVMPSSADGDFGYMLFIKDWSIYKFILKKVMFRIGSEHAIEGMISAAEMQLVFIQDMNYYSPGRRIFLDSNYLIISVPFMLNPDPRIESSRLLEFMNLSKFAVNPTLLGTVGMSRNIKLHQFIMHQPAFMYKGTLTYPECQNAIWVIFTKYQLLSSAELTLLRNAIVANIQLSVDKPYNTRDLKSLRADTVIYRNYEDLNALVMTNTLLNYNNSYHIKITVMLLFTLLVMLF